MSATRVSKNIGFTVPPRMAVDFERLAIKEGSTKSELFRRMFRLYQSYRVPFEEQGLAPSASWAERLLAEATAKERQSPLTNKEFRDGIERATRYGAKQAESIGVSSERETNDIVYEERQRIRNASRRS